MQLGVVFPQTEIGPDPGPIRAYAGAVADLGYRHLLTYDHVVGADPAVYPGWAGPYDLHSTFHETFVLFGYLAAFSSLELVTGIVILPQRQTVLVAKQAAEVDLLSEGRLRLGIGIGWNHVEYDALGPRASRPYGAPDGSPTGGSPRSLPAPASKRPSRSSGQARPRPGVTRPRSRWRGESRREIAISSGSRVRRRSGGRPARPTWRSTRWVRDWQGSTTTSLRWPKRRR